MLTAHKVAEFAKKEIVALTGLPVDTISAIARKEDNWVVTLDLLELRMVPNTQDVLATYEVEMNDTGANEMLSYRRIGRYRRDQLGLAYV